MNTFIRTIFLFVMSTFFTVAFASIVIPMYLTHNHKVIGTVTAQNTKYGLLLTPQLHNLPKDIHGFHIHQNPNCGKKGMAAGGHFDPKKTKQHLGPYNTQGHLGDLPVLIVNKNGKATLPVLAPRLNEKTIKGHALMVHAGGDNYSDSPKKLGGGGKRIACGVIK